MRGLVCLAAGRTRRTSEVSGRRNLAGSCWGAPPLAWFMALSAGLLAGSASAELAYSSYLVDVGESDGLVLHGNLSGGKVDDLVVFEDGGETRDRRMALYAFDGTGWDLAYAADVPDDVIFVDMLESADQDRLLMFRRDHVDWLDPDGWTRTTLVSAPSVYNVPPLDVPQVGIVRDVNADALGDLVLADFDGYWVWLQDETPNADWIGPVKLKATPTAIARFRSASYRPREIYELDHDGDGRNDLAFWEDEQFLVYRANDASFDTQPVELELPIEVSSDDITISIGVGTREESDAERVTLYDVGDYNGDGVGDLVATTLTVNGFLDQSTRYAFYFGERVDGGTRFGKTPATAIESDGIQGPFETGDFDNDGRQDFAMASIDIGIGKIIAALLTGSVRFDVEFYFMRDNAYPEEPNVTKPIRFRFSLRNGSVLSGRWLETGDLTGDGLTDLLVPVDGGIEVYAGTGDDKLFRDRPATIPVDFPDTTMPGGVTVADLNDDGRDDIVMRFPPTEEDETNRIGVVLSR